MVYLTTEHSLIIIALAALWVTIPAYLPNSAATLLGGGPPMDFGKKFRDGRRILGDGKSWRGFVGGSLVGILIGLIQIIAIYPFDPDRLWGFGPLPRAFLIISVLAVGSLLGDCLGSFIKRRVGRGRGAKAPGLDQYDFIIGAWILIIIADLNWFLETFIYDKQIIGLIAVIVITPLLHRGVNIIGYKIGAKDVPW